jgi:hypothetical protein
MQGDSGGPLIDVNTKKQVGVVSWGTGCADPNYPGGMFPLSNVHSCPADYFHRLTTLSGSSFFNTYLVYSRVASSVYTNFISPYITKWSNTATRPPQADGCTDKGGFYDSDGVKYNCMWYSGTKDGGSRCSMYGNAYAHAGLTANMACCVCGGGNRSNTSKPTSKPTSTKRTSKPTSKPTSTKPTSKPTPKLSKPTSQKV